MNNKVVVSRVKLPPPGSGKARVCDLTAGSGRAGPDVGVKNYGANTPGGAPSSAPVHRVQTPELPTMARSLRRSSSESNMLVLPATGPESPSAVVQGAFLDKTLEESRTMASPTASQETPVDDMQSPIAAQATSDTITPRDLAAGPSGHGMGGSAPDIGTAGSAPVRGFGASRSRSGGALGSRSSPRPSPEASDRAASKSESAKGASVERARAAEPVARRQASPRQAARRVEAPTSAPPPRSRSEPPIAEKKRLPQLIEEIASHLQDTDREQPTDAKGWLNETAKLELFVEEMQWLIGQHDRRAPASNAEPNKKRELSVLRGDKDLRWARQQLKYYEKEHTRIVQLLGASDSSVLKQQAEEKLHMEEEIEKEQQRQRKLAADNKMRERSLARAAKEFTEEDGNAKALLQIERLEAELGVLRVKNASLEKQVQQTAVQVRKAQESRQAINKKEEHVSEMLGREDQQTRLAEQREEAERLRKEEETLRESVVELQEARKRAAKNHERAMREKAKHLSELQEQQADSEARSTRNEATERQLRRQLRQCQPRGRHSRAASPAVSPRPSPRVVASPGGGPSATPGASVSSSSMPAPSPRLDDNAECHASSAAIDTIAAESASPAGKPRRPSSRESLDPTAERAAIAIQRRARGNLARRAQRNSGAPEDATAHASTQAAAEASQEERAAIAIQRRARGNLARRAQQDVAPEQRAVVAKEVRSASRDEPLPEERASIHDMSAPFAHADEVIDDFANITQPMAPENVPDASAIPLADASSAEAALSQEPAQARTPSAEAAESQEPAKPRTPSAEAADSQETVTLRTPSPEAANADAAKGEVRRASRERAAEPERRTTVPGGAMARRPSQDKPAAAGSVGARRPSKGRK